VIIPSARRALSELPSATKNAAPAAQRAFPRSASVALIAMLVVLASCAGIAVALRYHQLGLTLTHYDARGHLVVARRIFDSLTPGWQQIGAVWLPLPHVLNALPVQVDAWYRSGASAVAFSIAGFAMAVGAIAWILLQATESPLAAVTGAAAFALNANVLYLQATPMTEPLLMGLTALAVAMLLQWTAGLNTRTTRSEVEEQARPGRETLTQPRRPFGSFQPTPIAIGATFALACLTRYEAWVVSVAALSAATWARWRRGESFRESIRQVAAIAVIPAIAVAAFLINSRVVTGAWFVPDGFFVPENKALGHPLVAATEVWYGVRSLSPSFVFTVGVAGAAALAVRAVVRVNRSADLVALSLASTAAVPWAAFLDGHPFRIRYMVPLVAIEAIGAGVVAGWLARVRTAAGALVLVLVVFEARPLDSSAPMIVEAQWDRPNLRPRAQVTECLSRPGSGEKIMASMGSLGHYMQEASGAGFELRDFLHEGNGDIWLSALTRGPRPFVEWVLIEEKAEGGDMLARLARENPRFLDGYSRVCEGAGLALYRRTSASETSISRSSDRRSQSSVVQSPTQNLNPIVNR
jgi:hypothetical protein